MLHVLSQYLYLNRILLLAIGLWPYKQSKLIRLQVILFYAVMIILILFQFMILTTLNRFSQIIIEVLSIVLFIMLCMIKYTSFCYNMDIIKHLLDLLQHTYNELKDERETAIMEKYWNLARYYTNALTLIGASCMFIAAFVLFLPFVLINIEIYVNQSHSSFLLWIKENDFVHQGKYFFFITFHTSITCGIGIFALIATGSMTIAYFLHACGMFRVASYRIKQAVTNSNLQISTKENKNLVIMGIIYAIDMHRKAIRFVLLLMSALNVSYFFLIATAVISGSINLFRVFDNISSGPDFQELILPFIFLLTIFIYMFLANQIPQEIMDHNNHLFSIVYDVEWYLTPLCVQKLILFLLQRGTKSFHVTIGGLFVASLEGFGKLATTLISYFTVMYSAKH